MDRFAPGGGVIFAGTYNGHPVGVGAALATIAELEDGERPPALLLAWRERAAERHPGDRRRARHPMHGGPLRLGVRALLHGRADRKLHRPAAQRHRERCLRSARTMCDHGIFMIPTALKRNHVSAAHTEADIDRTLEVAREVLGSLANQG